MIEILLFIAVAYIIYCVFRMLYNDIKLHKLHKAMLDLHRLPFEEWEAKWGEFVQKEYDKCKDPHRQEMEECMEFFKQFIRESEEGGEDETAK